MKNNISTHITYKESTKSNTAIKLGIDNQPSDRQLSEMVKVANAIFEPVRSHFGKPIAVTSFFRSEALNQAIKGSSSSQHMANNGSAIDIDADVYGGMTNGDIFNFIKDTLTFDQLIWEFGDDESPAWVHVSYNESNNRCIILKASHKIINGHKTTVYENYS